VAPATAGGWAPAAAAAAPDARRTARGETLLVVDDEASVRLALQRLLRKHGYEVLVAADGVEALALLERYNGPVDLLLTDMVMPRMGGRELATRFLRLQPRARVVYMSGYTEDDALRDDVRDAESSFLAKPFALTAVIALVRESLDRAAQDSGSLGGTHV
jgi:CheY-like chemotaxis protein